MTLVSIETVQNHQERARDLLAQADALLDGDMAEIGCAYPTTLLLAARLHFDMATWMDGRYFR